MPDITVTSVDQFVSANGGGFCRARAGLGVSAFGMQSSTSAGLRALPRGHEIALLRSLGAFAALPAPALEGLAAALSPLAVQSGQALIRQGDEGDRCYAIVEGQLDVTLDGRHVRTVTRGDLVGEIALLRYVPRTASVTAATDCAVLVLTRDAFLTAVVGHAPTHAIADRATDARLDELARIAGDG